MGDGFEAMGNGKRRWLRINGQTGDGFQSMGDDNSNGRWQSMAMGGSFKSMGDGVESMGDANQWAMATAMSDGNRW